VDVVTAKLLIPPTATYEDRFWSHVERGPGCWLWTGSINPDTGYGQVRYRRRVRLAHRVSYELSVGEIPTGLQLDHLCRTTACVNPAHLEPVTPRENTARSTNRSSVALRTNRCINGHEFTPENTRVRKNGSRACIECQRQRNRRFRARRRTS
jgi:hypothetical protein